METKETATIVFVSLGEHPDYLEVALSNCAIFNKCPIVVIGDTELKYPNLLKRFSNIKFIHLNTLKQTPNSIGFERVCPDFSYFRNNYWKKVKQRFFVIEQYMLTHNVKNLIQLETDIMVYNDLNQFLRGFQKKDMFAPFISNIYGIPGIVWFRDLKACNDFVTFALENMKEIDMSWLVMYLKKYPERIGELPGFPDDRFGKRFCEHMEIFDNTIFDACPIGQLLYGYDPRNFNGQLVKELNPNSDIKYDASTFLWKKDNDVNKLFIKVDGKEYLVNMLHMHSKNLKQIETAVEEIKEIGQCQSEQYFKKKVFDYIDLDANTQIYVRDKPKQYLKNAIMHFNELQGKVIVEVGSARSRMEHSIDEFNPVCCNDGHSTYFWKTYTNAEVFTVDIDPGCKQVIDGDERLRGVHAYTMDAIQYLSEFPKKIDLLFLDAWDVIPNTDYAEQHLKAYLTVKDKLSEKCLVLIDDTDVGNAGKGQLLIPRLTSDGFIKLLGGRQTLFYRDITRNPCQFDVVIPVGDKDADSVKDVIDTIIKNVSGFRSIYVVGTPNIIKNIDNCIKIDEKIFPFNLDTVVKYHGSGEKTGWYLQQLIKLYAGRVIPGIMDTYLVVDADVYFLKPMLMVENGKYIFTPGTEYHPPYFEHMKKLHPTLKRVKMSWSGIAHHMVFNKEHISNLFTLVETYHNGTFWEIFLKLVSSNRRNGAGASEYEIYFNYMQIYAPDKIIIKQRKWINGNSIQHGIREDCDYVAVHWHMQKE